MSNEQFSFSIEHHMLSESKGRHKINYCFYHGPCHDGTVSAWIANRFAIIEHLVPLAAGAKYDGEICSDGVVFFLDLFPPFKVLERMLQCGNKVYVLDHHAGNKREFDSYKLSEKDAANLTVIFDTERAGCQITWDFFYDQCQQRLGYHGRDGRPWVVNYIGDRDRNVFREHAREVTTALIAKGLVSFEALEWLCAMPVKEAIAKFEHDGELLIAARYQEIKELVFQYAKPATLVYGEKTYRVYVISVPHHLVNDMADLLFKLRHQEHGSCDFAALYQHNFDTNTFKVSLRAPEKSDVDVSLIAREFGGNGHTKAAGFTLESSKSIYEAFKPVTVVK
jgi:uncharacterized protein